MCDAEPISLTPEVVEAFAGVKLRSFRFAIAKIEDKSVTLVSTGPRDQGIEELRAQLGDDPCQIVYDFEHTLADGANMSKICLFTYVPDTSKSMALATPNCTDTIMATVMA